MALALRLATSRGAPIKRERTQHRPDGWGSQCRPGSFLQYPGHPLNGKITDEMTVLVISLFEIGHGQNEHAKGLLALMDWQILLQAILPPSMTVVFFLLYQGPIWFHFSVLTACSILMNFLGIFLGEEMLGLLFFLFFSQLFKGLFRRNS